MVASRSAPYNVVAEYRDPPAARQAIEALQIRGVEAANIHISGPGAVTAIKTSSLPDTSKIDGRLATRTFGRSVAGMIIGAVVALVLTGIGVIITLAATDTVGGVWISIAFGAAALVGIVGGGMIAAARALPLMTDYDLTFADRDSGEVFVSVHAHESDDIARVEKILREHLALRVRRYQASA